MKLFEYCSNKNYPFIRRYCVANIPICIYAEELFVFDIIDKEFSTTQRTVWDDKENFVNIWFQKKTFSEIGIEKSLSFVQYNNGFIFLDHFQPNQACCIYDDYDDELFRMTIIKSVVAYAMSFPKGVIHGSLIHYRGVGISLIGESGFGKSSLSAGLVLKYGAKLVADDGYIFDLGVYPTIAHGLNTYTGIDLNALRQLEFEIPKELTPEPGSMADFRKRRYVRMEMYKENSVQDHSIINVVLFLVPSYSHRCLLKPLSEDDIKRNITNMAIPCFYKDLPSSDVKNQIVNQIKEIPCYEFYLSDNYLKNLEYIYEAYFKNSPKP